MFDSVEEDEYIETINKLGANVRCLEQAEGKLYTAHRAQTADSFRILCSSAIAEPVKTCDMHACLNPTRLVFHAQNWAKGAFQRILR